MSNMGNQQGDGSNLVIALPAEARPIINLLNLKRDQVNMAMPVYGRDHIRLVISGAGASASAHGVRYLHSIRPDTKVQWYNIGICGHGSLEVGVALLINHIIEQQSARCWSLKIPHRITCPVGALTCVAKPQADYADGMAYDMESSGFIDTVKDVASLDAARVFKIVSDNPDNGARGISGKIVRSLVEQQIGLIQSMVE
jgi:hypothetical protein